MAKYQHNYSGRGIVADFRRLLETRDMAKLTPRLYKALTLHGGFIAHYGLDGFRQTFDGRLSDLLRGEYQPLDADDHHPRLHSPHLEDSVYKDGMTAGDIMRAICEIGRELGPQVRESERFLRRGAEIGHLCERYGIDNITAAALVDGKPVEVVA
jgi:hypothetical protein